MTLSYVCSNLPRGPEPHQHNHLQKTSQGGALGGQWSGFAGWDGGMRVVAVFMSVTSVLIRRMILGVSSAIGVHPNYSEARHLRSSVPHSKPDISKNQIASLWMIPLPKQTYTPFIFRNTINHWLSDYFGLWSPVLRKTFSAEMCYFYRRTRHCRAFVLENSLLSIL